MTYHKQSPSWRSLLGVAAVILAAAPATICTAQGPPAGEMLANGGFNHGLTKWKVEESGAKGLAEAVKEGPSGQSALRIKVLNVGSDAWRLQVYQGGLRIEKGKKYTLEFWAKAAEAGVITVNCMQNHAPWEHHGAATEMALGTTWKLMHFAFDGPWDDKDSRITFTNLATKVGQTYWFTNCSLKAVPGSKPAAPKPIISKGRRVVVWDGEKANVGSGWANPKSSSILRATGDSHSGNTAMELKFKTSHIWVGAGWDWFAWKTGTDIGTDTREMKTLSFWMKSKGKTGALEVQLQCNGDILDTPEHHTIKVKVGKYCPQFLDGKWHQVRIPLTELTQPVGYDPRIVSQIQFGFMAEGEVDGSFLFDDISFDDK